MIAVGTYRTRADAELTVVGESLFRTQRRQERRIRALAERLGVASSIRFVGGRSPHEVARAMSAAAVVVVPSIPTWSPDACAG